MATGPRVYLDACCLNRPFDDQTQDRIRLEAEAVLLILSHAETGNMHWLSSNVLSYELQQIPDRGRRERVLALISAAHETLHVNDNAIARGQQLEALGFDAFDALHLACAEQAQADLFLTTDDRLLSRARRLAEQLHVGVANPLVWLQERARA
jgi:predicted nucleic acid-binding protein